MSSITHIHKMLHGSVRIATLLKNPNEKIVNKIEVKTKFY